MQASIPTCTNALCPAMHTHGKFLTEVGSLHQALSCIARDPHYVCEIHPQFFLALDASAISANVSHNKSVVSASPYGARPALGKLISSPASTVHSVALYANARNFKASPGCATRSRVAEDPMQALAKESGNTQAKADAYPLRPDMQSGASFGASSSCHSPSSSQSSSSSFSRGGTVPVGIFFSP